MAYGIYMALIATPTTWSYDHIWVLCMVIWPYMGIIHDQTTIYGYNAWFVEVIPPLTTNDHMAIYGYHAWPYGHLWV